ncbi:MAG: tyrosine-type recombinase/integrase [Gammaproteobacteria bacterium]
MDDALARIRAILDAEGVKPRDYTVKEAIGRLCREELPRLRHPNKARSHIERLRAFVNAEGLADIPALAARYRAAHPHLSTATINRRLGWLRRIARLAYRRWGWLARPVYVSLAAEHNARHRYLSLPEVERLIDACDHEPTRDAVILAVHTGMRQGEIFALNRTNVRGGCLWLPDRYSKNREPRLIPILPRMREAVARLPLPCTARYMWGRFKRACRQAELADLRFHDLRHTTGSLLINAGYPLKVVQEVLGHLSVQSANRYAHLSVETKRAALERVFGA